jgi:hypothetical protein
MSEAVSSALHAGRADVPFHLDDLYFILFLTRIDLSLIRDILSDFIGLFSVRRSRYSPDQALSSHYQDVNPAV